VHTCVGEGGRKGGRPGGREGGLRRRGGEGTDRAYSAATSFLVFETRAWRVRQLMRETYSRRCPFSKKSLTSLALPSSLHPCCLPIRSLEQVTHTTTHHSPSLPPFLSSFLPLNSSPPSGYAAPE
jgi:hypothetical protein